MWSNTALCAAAAKVANRPVKLALSREGVSALSAVAPFQNSASLWERTRAEDLLRSFILPRRRRRPTAVTLNNARFLHGISMPRIISLSVKKSSISTRSPTRGCARRVNRSALLRWSRQSTNSPINLKWIRSNSADQRTRKRPDDRRGIFGACTQSKPTNAARKNSVGTGAIPNHVQDATASGSSGKVWRRLIIPFIVFRRRRAFAFPPDGTAIVQAAANEMGMGTATVQIQHAAERLGLPIDKVSFTTAIRVCPSRRWRAARIRL